MQSVIFGRLARLLGRAERLDLDARAERTTRRIDGLDVDAWRLVVRHDGAIGCGSILEAALEEEDGDEYVELLAELLSLWTRVHTLDPMLSAPGFLPGLLLHADADEDPRR